MSMKLVNECIEMRTWCISYLPLISKDSETSFLKEIFIHSKNVANSLLFYSTSKVVPQGQNLK